MTASEGTGGGRQPGIPIRIQVLAAPFDSCAEQLALTQGRHGTGALVTFVGLMRDLFDDGPRDGGPLRVAPETVSVQDQAPEPTQDLAPESARDSGSAPEPIRDLAPAPDLASGTSRGEPDADRADSLDRPPDRMILEHYPGMTEKALTAIAESAARRWELDAITILHRVGTLAPGDPIVFVGVTSRHRGAAFRACEFLIDYLKTRAPFWKKECGAAGERWVAARETDRRAEERWLTAND